MTYYVIFLGVFSSPVFCFSISLTDSLDVQVSRELDRIYNDIYFTNFDKAATAIDLQADRATSAGRWHMVISALVLKANCAYYHYRADETYSILLTTEALAEKYKAALDSLDPVKVYRSEINYVRGMHFHELGDFSRSIASFEIIVANHRNYHGLDPMYLYYVHSFIGHAYLQLMLYDKAYLNYEQGLAWLQSSNAADTHYQQGLANLLKGQCKEYRAKYSGEDNQTDEALLLYKKALQLLLPGKEKISYRGALTSAYSRMASFFSARQQYDSAIYYLNASLKFHPENDPMHVSTYADFGDIYKKQERYDKALQFYNKSVAVAEGSYDGKHYRKSMPAFKKAALLLAKKDFQQALYTCQVGLGHLVKESDVLTNLNTIPVYQSEHNVPLLLEGLALKGKIHFYLYQQNKNSEHLRISLEIYKQSITIVQEAQKRYPESEYKQNLAARAQSLYEDALETTFYAHEKNPGEQNYSSMMFTLLESNKSTMLRDASSNTYAQHYYGVPEGLLDKESYLKGTITSMRSKLYQNPGDTSVAKWKNDLYLMSTQYDSLLAKIKTDHLNYYEFKYGEQILSLEEVRKHLDPETLLVEYFWGDRALYMVGFDRKKIVIRKVDIDTTLSDAVTALIKNISQIKEDKNVPNFTEVSHSIYDKILRPVIDQWPATTIKSLIIIPDGMLSYFPFDILLTSGDNHDADYSALPYLLNDYTIRNLFSATLIQPKMVNNSLSFPYLGFAPSYTQSRQPISLLQQRSGLNATALTHNVQEVTDASDYFSGKTFLRKDATEKTFKTMASRGKMLHLSMHAFTDDQEPSFSGLVFTPSDSAAIEDDGLLYLHELYNLSLNADLAVLSACETGSGRYARGEGIMSLGRAFRYAGCRNIVMSLWKVNDRSTSEIMKMFFQNLHRGMNKDEALRQAKLSFLTTSKNKHFAHPYYWSAFTLTGDPSPLATGRWFNWSYVSIAGVFIVLIVFVSFHVVRKKQAIG
jgi:CHAT domain-containing protein